MTGARNNILFGMKKSRASVMRAQPAKGDVRILRGPQQKTRPVVLRIRKHLGAAHWNLAHGGNRRNRIRLIASAQKRNGRADRRHDGSNS